MTSYSSYCPEDDRLRLYVGRVPREEYLALKAEGWTSTPKQDCDFVAVWTPKREATALKYGDGVIEDEDQSPEDRAADRAERFSGYRDKRLDEAIGHADRYESGPSAHGYQSQAKADRMAARHDRIGGRAVSQWDKAEYWQQRTAGVISHALYVSSPAVRMGRIKTIEADLRKELKWLEEYRAKHARWTATAAEQDAEKAHKMAYHMANCYDHSYDYQHPRPESMPSHMRERGTSLYSLLTLEVDPITGHEAAAMWLAVHSEPKESTQYSRHLELRLAYERQMLEAQGGRLASAEIEVGGKLGGKLIMKVNKSATTSRVTSVSVIGPKVTGWTYRAQNILGTEYALHQFATERMAPGSYVAPTPESLAELEAIKAQQKAAAPVKDACPLINPTEADAQRLLDKWNAEGLAKFQEGKRSGRCYGEFEPAKLTKISQKTYSEVSKGAYARAETLGLAAGGVLASRFRKSTGKDVCKIRTTYGGSGAYTPKSIIILTDKPGKPLPASVWETQAVEVLA